MASGAGRGRSLSPGSCMDCREADRITAEEEEMNEAFGTVTPVNNTIKILVF